MLEAPRRLSPHPQALSGWLLESTYPARRPGWNVAHFRMRFQGLIVVGLTPEIAFFTCKRFYPERYVLFRPEHWVGNDRHGKWVESHD